MFSAYEFPRGTRLELTLGDITNWAGDAIVNAANERMLGGGGVDGAIHRAAGPELKAACIELPEVSPGVRCPTGEARITPAFGRLRSRYVIHTVGPVYRDAEQARPLLNAAYRQSMRVAETHSIGSIAFPAVSCGVYGYPLHEAAEVALSACLNGGHSLQRIAFVLFDERVFSAWSQAAQRRLKPSSD